MIIPLIAAIGCLVFDFLLITLVTLPNPYRDEEAYFDKVLKELKKEIEEVEKSR